MDYRYSFYVDPFDHCVHISFEESEQWCAAHPEAPRKDRTNSLSAVERFMDGNCGTMEATDEIARYIRAGKPASGMYSGLSLEQDLVVFTAWNNREPLCRLPREVFLAILADCRQAILDYRKSLVNEEPFQDICCGYTLRKDPWHRYAALTFKAQGQTVPEDLFTPAERWLRDWRLGIPEDVLTHLEEGFVREDGVRTCLMVLDGQVWLTDPYEQPVGCIIPLNVFRAALAEYHEACLETLRMADTPDTGREYPCRVARNENSIWLEFQWPDFVLETLEAVIADSPFEALAPMLEHLQTGRDYLQDTIFMDILPEGWVRIGFHDPNPSRRAVCLPREVMESVLRQWLQAVGED